MDDKSASHRYIARMPKSLTTLTTTTTTRTAPGGFGMRVTR